MGLLVHFFSGVLTCVALYIIIFSNPNRVPEYARFVAWKPQTPVPDSYPSKSLLSAEKIFDGNIFLPESTIVSSDQKFYVSSGNGSVLRIDPEKKRIYHEVFVGGRPLGMAWAKDGRLLIADALLGLVAVNLTSKSTEILCNFVDGRAVKFANAVSVAKDGTIFFTDSTDMAPVQKLDGTYDTHSTAVIQILLANPTGRVIKYNPETRESQVILGGLSFANGIGLSSDETYLLICDLGHNRLMKLWLKGDHSVNTEVVLDNIPGFPDNLQPASDKGWWLALASQRSFLIDLMHEYPFVKYLLSKIPMKWIPKPPPHAQVLKLDSDLKVEFKLFDNSGHIPVITDAMEHQGKLYLGAVNANYWARMDVSSSKE